MCFRPAEVSTPPVNCPNCGEEVFYSNGVLPNKCPFCREPLEGVGDSFGAPGAPAAPGAPGAPMAPGAPGASSVPKAPAAPGVSGSPSASGADWKSAIGGASAMPAKPSSAVEDK